MGVESIRELGIKIKNNIKKVIVGKDDVIDIVLVSLISSGHVLLEDVPGVGKTMLAKCLSKSIDCEFKRIQFTPDLLPSDLSGINYYNQKEGEFVFREGPIFACILLADEINRATPRTQSSLLECMEEQQVTIDGETKLLPEPFFVIATQNPVEIQGTFPLPEAQMDRFIVRIKMGYPSLEEGKLILDRYQSGSPITQVDAVADANDIITAQKELLKVKIGSASKEYVLKIIERTRKHDNIILGVSPRGSIALMKASQAFAALNGRAYVTPDDIKYLAPFVLSHRLLLKGHAVTSGTDAAESLIHSILNEVKTPIE